MYDLIQSALTAAAEVIAIAGLTGIAAHAIWKQHTSWMKMYCPPVAAYTGVGEEVAAPQPEPEVPAIADDDIWETPILTSAPRYWERPSQEIKPALMLMPAASEIKKSEQPLEINLNSLDPTTLRKLCTQYKIAWKNARGKNRHATKSMMVYQLSSRLTA